MNDGNTGYPWSTGDVLLAADLNQAIANAGAIGAVAVGKVISSDQFQLKPDFVQLSGTISWSGSTVTISGAGFSASDIGKTLIMPCGPGVGLYGDPALVKITAVVDGSTSCSVDTSNPTHPFTGSLQINNNATPTIVDYGAGGAHVGDVMVLQGGTFARPATFGVIQTKALTAPVVVSAGGGGMPLATVYLRATTGHGRRPLFMGKTDANGRLDLTQVPPLSLVDGGALYQDLADNTHEPLAADQRQLVFPGSWVAGATQIVLSSAILGTIIPQLLRVGMSVSAVSDTPNTPGIVGGFGGSVITAIDAVDPHLITISPAAVAAGTNQDVTFAVNRSRLTVHAAFNVGDTVLTLTDGPLPAWVQDGTLISGTGIYGGGDPAGDPNAQTTFTVAPGRTQITLSQPTTAAVVQPVGLLINPALTGVVANITCVPVQLIVKDRGIYTTMPPLTGTPPAVTLTKGVVSCTITPYGTPEPLIVGMGTDNAAAIDAFASAVRAATTSTLQEDAALGVEAIWRPGNYLSTGSGNFTNLAKPGLRLKFHGVVLHSAVPPVNLDTVAPPLSPLGRIALDFRKMRWGVLDQPTVTGDQYFPPYVGMAFGRFDVQPSDGSYINTPIAFGRFLFAGITIQNTESTVYTGIDTANTEVPPAFPPLVPVPGLQTQAHPVFCLVIDGDQHWDMPCEFIGSAAPLHKGDHQSFLHCRILGAAARGSGCIPWAIGGASDILIDAGYSDTNGPPAILWFGDGLTSTKIDIHCEANFSSGNPDGKGLQDNIMLAGIKNSILQFNANYYDPVTQARNAVITYDNEGYYGGVRDTIPGGPPQGATPYTGGLRGGIISTSHGTVEVGFNRSDIQFFDSMRTVYRVTDGTPLNVRDLSYWGGDLITNGVAYTAIAHMLNLPGQRTGRTIKGNLSQDLHYNGVGNFNSLALDGGIVVGKDITSFPGTQNYFASLNIGVNGQQTYGHWDNQRLQLGVRGSAAHPSTAPAIVGFVPPGNTILDGGPTLDHSILVASPGTLDIQGSGTNNAYVRVNGTLVVTGGVADPGAVINSQTIATVTANAIAVAAGTNYVVVQDSIHAVNTLTVGSGTLADGYDLWMSFPNGGVFSGQTLSAHGNLTLKTLGGGWSILSKFG